MELLIIFLLILLNGLFSMSEIAMVSARKNRLEADAQRGDARARTALRLSEDPSRFLSTVQIGITLIGVLTGIYSGENITQDVEAWVSSIGWMAPYAHAIAVALVVFVVTFFSLVLGELVPKRIGLNMPEPIAKAVAIPMQGVAIIAAPFIWLLTRTGDAVLWLLRIKKRGAGSGVTEDEIRAMVQEGAAGGAVEVIEHDIVERVFTLGDRRVSSLMTHRRDVVMVRVEDDALTVRRVMLDALHAHYPVVSGNLDDVLGVVRLEVLLARMDASDFAVHTAMDPPRFLHEDMPAYKALEHFKSTGTSFALVADELGSTSGVITLMDILQALAGDVSDFHRDDFTLVQRQDGTWLVDGQFPLHELLVRLDRSQLTRDVDVDTIAGLVLKQTGRIPSTGDSVTWMGLTVEVADMDGARIDKVIIAMSNGD